MCREHEETCTGLTVHPQRLKSGKNFRPSAIFVAVLFKIFWLLILYIYILKVLTFLCSDVQLSFSSVVLSKKSLYIQTFNKQFLPSNFSDLLHIWSFNHLYLIFVRKWCELEIFFLLLICSNTICWLHPSQIELSHTVSS